MTVDEQTKPLEPGLLKKILEHVQSIDRTVEEVLDRLNDQSEESRYRGEYFPNGYHHPHDYD